jgi:drug/metabolite transporter (DMT)-like permease
MKRRPRRYVLSVTRRYLPLLLLLTSLWGSSFLFIEIALREVEPSFLIMLRLLSAALVLVPVLVVHFGARGAYGRLRDGWRPLLVLGAVNAAIPFTLIAWGQKHIDSGIAAIANASVPIFVALLAIRFRPSERVTGARALGIGAGIVGVAVLAGANPEGGWWAVVGTLAVVAAAFLYAVGALFAQSHVEQFDPIVFVTGSTIAGALIILPLGVAQAPDHVPGWEVWLAVAALGIGAMAFGQFVYYVLLEHHGSTRTALVTYLLPGMALVLGVVFLDEPLTVAAVAGLALVLLGVALGSGMLRPGRRRAPATAHAP